jgi:hypothetical protein
MGVNAAWFLTLPPSRGEWLGLSLMASTAFGILFLLEWAVFRAAEVPKARCPWIAATWAPFLFLNPFRFLITHMTFPLPHDFFLRKMEVTAGLVWVTHLFLFAGLAICALWKQNKPRPARSFTILALFLFPALLLTTTRCDLTGDEPHYLLMAQSILQDGDLDLANNYANGDYLRFYGRGDLMPQALEHASGSRLYSHHPLGPVILMLPGYAFLGRNGAALTMALLSAWLLGLILRLMQSVGYKPKVLMEAGVVGLLSSPLLLYSGLLFPEIPTACLLALFLKYRMELNPRGMGLVWGALLWFHNRNVLLMVPLALIALYELCRDRGMRRYFLGKLAMGAAVPLVLLVVYFKWVYGVWTPLGAHNEPFSSLFHPGRFFIGLFGLTLDQETGLWFHYPVFTALPAGIYLMWRSRDPLKATLIGTLLFYFLFMCFYENLGQTPAARFMVCLTPLLLFLLAPVLQKAKRGTSWWELLAVLAAAGIAVNWILAGIPWMRYNRLEGENWIVKLMGNALHLPWTKFEPSFHMDPVPLRSWLLGLFWFAVVAVVTFKFLENSRPTRSREVAKNS